jgi:hypothetical protein
VLVGSDVLHREHVHTHTHKIRDGLYLPVSVCACVSCMNMGKSDGLHIMDIFMTSRYRNTNFRKLILLPSSGGIMKPIFLGPYHRSETFVFI